jgi:uncharacterized protein YijF (DUF1287 family)
MITDVVIRALDSEIADLQRIVDADEAILQHEKSQEKHDQLINEICRLQDRIAKLRKKREHFEFG